MALNHESGRARSVALRSLLNEWDPIGVADLVEDEYDCQLQPIRTRLEAGATAGSLAAYLRVELVDHFGLDPGVCDVDAFARRVVARWAVVG